MKTTGLAIMLITLFGFSTSCSFQKRVHRPGYHIDWHMASRHASPVVEESPSLVREDVALSSPVAPEIEDAGLAMMQEIPAVVTEQEVHVKQKVKAQLKTVLHTPGAAGAKRHREIPIQLPQEDPPAGRSVNVFALLSFIFSFLGAGLLVTFGFPFLMGMLAVIFGIVGLIQIAQNSDRWFGKGFAIAGIILGSIVILVFWTILLLFLLFLTWLL